MRILAACAVGQPSRRQTLVGPMPLVVSVGFVPPSILSVSFGRLGLTEQIGRVGRLAIRPGGPLVPCGGPLVPAPLAALVVVVGHSTEPSPRAQSTDLGLLHRAR